MRSPNSRFPRLTAVAILWLAVLTVASSWAAAPPATAVQGDVADQRPRVIRPAVTINGRLPQSPTPRLPAKPFANHVRPSPVSPYINLFRRDNAGGTIDNYSTLVKPLLQQQRMNRAVAQNRGRLNAMEPSLRVAENNLERINRQTRVLQGRPPTTRTSSRFMNHGHRFGQR